MRYNADIDFMEHWATFKIIIGIKIFGWGILWERLKGFGIIGDFKFKKNPF